MVESLVMNIPLQLPCLSLEGFPARSACVDGFQFTSWDLAFPRARRALLDNSTYVHPEISLDRSKDATRGSWPYY